MATLLKEKIEPYTVDIDGAAALTGLSRKTIEKAVYFTDGKEPFSKIHSFKFGGKRLMYWSDVKEWIDKNRVEC